GYTPVVGAFRVEGPGGFGNEDMTFLPIQGVLYHWEVHSTPDGLFTIKITDPGNPANVFQDSFTNLASYGGPIGFSVTGEPSGLFDNLSISLANAVVPGDFDSDHDVDGADFV